MFPSRSVSPLLVTIFLDSLTLSLNLSFWQDYKRKSCRLDTTHTPRLRPQITSDKDWLNNSRVGLKECSTVCPNKNTRCFSKMRSRQSQGMQWDQPRFSAQEDQGEEIINQVRNPWCATLISEQSLRFCASTQFGDINIGRGISDLFISLPLFGPLSWPRATRIRRGSFPNSDCTAELP